MNRVLPPYRLAPQSFTKGYCRPLAKKQFNGTIGLVPSQPTYSQVYLDNNATSPVHPEVLEEMLPYFTKHYANPTSAHNSGTFTMKSISRARDRVAELLNAEAREITFCSGATEANNLVLRGVVELAGPGHIVTWRAEHPSVRETVRTLQEAGCEVTLLDLLPSGGLDIPALEKAVRTDTLLVSVMLANNETGILNDVQNVANIAHERGALVHTDATQGVGKIQVDMALLGVDFLTLSAHKFHGPKGVGALVSRRGTSLVPQITGGGQERDLRSGTLNVTGIVGLGAAAQLAQKTLARPAHLLELRDTLDRMVESTGGSVVGKSEPRLPNTTLGCWEGLEADAVVVSLVDVDTSTGSACSSLGHEPSHALRSMGMTIAQASGCLRMSTSHMNTTEEVSWAAKRIAGTVNETLALTREAQ